MRLFSSNRWALAILFELNISAFHFGYGIQERQKAHQQYWATPIIICELIQLGHDEKVQRAILSSGLDSTMLQAI